MLILKRLPLLLLLVVFAATIHGQTYHGKTKEIQKILKNIDNFSQYYMAGEAEKMVDCYTTDGKIFPDRTGIREGAEALKKYWTLPEGMKVLHHKVTPKEIRITKKHAYDYGYYEGETLRPNGEKVSWQGKYVIIWEKVGKEWKIYLDIWNRVEDPKEMK